MPSPNDISSRIRSKLRLTEPELDTSIGTVSRKLIDAFAEAGAEISTDSYLLDYQYDVDTRTGDDLDSFVRLFGFTRLPARRATGQITFARSSPATDDIVIPVGTRVATSTPPQVVFSTVVPGIISTGGSDVTVPAQALNAGSLGNVPTSSVSIQLSSTQGISTFSNPVAFTNGTDAESDSSLRDRFKRTIFRSMAGTRSMFAGTALEDPQVSQVNVIGSSSRYREQIEIVAGTATSTVPSAKSIYEGSSFFGTDLDSGVILKEGVHYTFDDTVVPPTVTSLSATIVPDGIYELDFEYVPLASRNIEALNVTNRVDLWVKGTRATVATESLVFDTSKVFQSGDALQKWYDGEYVRADETSPTVGNFIVPYTFAPLITPTNSGIITIDGVDYTEDVDFWMVHRTGPFGWSPQSAAGIEFNSTANGLVLAQPVNGMTFVVPYTFNAVPTDVQSSIQRWRLVTSDVWVHQAIPIYLNFYFYVILKPGFTEGSVNTDIFAALSTFIDRIGFNSVIQTSDVISVCHSVPGVDAIRFRRLADDVGDPNWAIQRVEPVGSTVLETYDDAIGHAVDVIFGDDEIPVLNLVDLTVVAQNSYGAV